MLYTLPMNVYLGYVDRYYEPPIGKYMALCRRQPLLALIGRIRDQPCTHRGNTAESLQSLVSSLYRSDAIKQNKTQIGVSHLRVS